MLTSPWSDLVIALVVAVLVLLGARAGWRSGATRFTVAFGGLVVGLMTGFVVARWLVSDELSEVAHLLADAACVLGTALIGAWAGAHLGDLLRRGAAHLHLGVVDRCAGALLRGGATFAACALFAGTIAAFSTTSASTAARVADSPVLTSLAGLLPPAAILARDVERLLPSGTPNDLLALVPAAQDLAPAPSEATLRETATAHGDSVVQVEATGCGAPTASSAGTAPSVETTSQGTGFVAVSGSGADGSGALVVTNAHVVRGASEVSVSGAFGTSDAAVVVDDPGADIAVLSVAGRSGPALTLADAPAANGSAAVILGHPEDAPLTATAAVVVQRLPVAGDAESSGLRESYRLVADVRHGNSGSPLLTTDGRVVGVVNALGLAGSGEGFALTLTPVRADLAVAESGVAVKPATTGTCQTS